MSVSCGSPYQVWYEEQKKQKYLLLLHNCKGTVAWALTHVLTWPTAEPQLVTFQLKFSLQDLDWLFFSWNGLRFIDWSFINSNCLIFLRWLSFISNCLWFLEWQLATLFSSSNYQPKTFSHSYYDHPNLLSKFFWSSVAVFLFFPFLILQLFLTLFKTPLTPPPLFWTFCRFFWRTGRHFALL